MRKMVFFVFILSSLFQMENKSPQIIHNKSVPLYRSAFSTIGAEECIIGINKRNFESDDLSIADVIIDRKDFIFFLTNSRIYKINSDGQVILAKRIEFGQGPGEFQNKPSEISCDFKGNIYIYDGFKIVMFNNNIVFKKNIQVRLLPDYKFVVDHNGNIFTMKFDGQSDKLSLKFAKYSNDGALIFEIPSNIQSQNENLGGISLFINHAYSPKGYYSLNDEGDIYFTENTQYRITKYNSVGNLISIISMPEKSIKVSSEEKNNILRQLNKVKINGTILRSDIRVPSNRPFLRGLICDDTGIVYVIRTKSVLNETKEEIVDVFNKKGIFLYRWVIPFFPRIIAKDYFYYFGYDDDEATRLMRVKVNRNIIKNSADQEGF
jgi:hypothetical protein